MSDYKDIAWLFERAIHKYIQFEKLPQDYCEGLILTQAEIHTVAIIGDHEGIGITQLAKMRGITKGAASQMIYKLVDKKLVEKRVSPDSDAAVNLFLTELGKQARAEHRKRHSTMGNKFADIMDRMPEDVRNQVVELIQSFEAELDMVEK